MIVSISVLYISYPTTRGATSIEQRSPWTGRRPAFGATKPAIDGLADRIASHSSRRVIPAVGRTLNVRWCSRRQARAGGRREKAPRLGKAAERH